VLTWLRDVAAAGAGYEELLAQAAQVPPGSDGLVCLPHFSGTATPTFRSDVRGGFLGLSLGHGRAHLVRAIAEAACFLARDALSLMAQAGQPVAQLRMLGGATQSDFWMQMLADAVGLRIEIPACGEAAVLGAAICAGAGAGKLASIAQGAERFYRPARRFCPRTETAGRYGEAYAAYREAMERIYPGALGASSDGEGKS
jgi:sugar (pentulose or hexulose) kinase